MVKGKITNAIVFTPIFLSLLFLFGCELTSPQRFDETEYVITGLLYAGEYVTIEHPIYVNRAINAEEGNIMDVFIDSAEVTLYELSPERRVRESIALEFGAPFGFYDPDSSMLIKAGYTYRIEATIEGERVWAETTVPHNISIITDSTFTKDGSDSIYPSIDYDNMGSKHPIYLRTYDESPVILYLEIYCLEDYDDAEMITDFGPPEFDEDDYESLREGSITFTYTPKYHASTPGLPAGYYVTKKSYYLSIMFGGKHKLTLYSIDENYYNYLYKSEGFYYGGINNGLGYFGSASGDDIFTNVIP